MSTTIDDDTTSSSITLKVIGLGHKLTLTVPSSLTVGGLKQEIQNQTDIPVGYQRLICHGKNLDHDDEIVGEKGLDRTKVMLLHNASYVTDRDALEKIQKIQGEIDQLDKQLADDHDPHVIHELITQICCKLDAVDVSGSETLRDLRRQALHRAEAMDPSSGSGSKGEKE